ncbi:MAG: GNAT family N-acetyltransferase [Saprospiraceae bacterium]|nr:GNAT family N-acetyltransferase [Saprospiraceae bacterium]
MKTIPINELVSLTAFETNDKSNLLLYMNDELIYQNTLRVPIPYTSTDAIDWLNKCEVELQTFNQPINWAIRHETAGLIGGIGRFCSTGFDGHRDEIGYWLAQPFRGAGLMSSIVAKYCTFLLNAFPDLMRLEAHVFPHNPASARVLEKCGFVQEAYLRSYHKKNGQLLDSVQFALFR